MTAVWLPGRGADGAALWITSSAAAVVTLTYHKLVEAPQAAARAELHASIIAGTAGSPYQYRVLVPFVVEAARRLMDFVMSAESALLFAYVLYDFIAIWAFLILLGKLFATWFTGEQSLIGSLLVACLLPVSLRDHYYQPWSLLEATLFTAALLLMCRQREGVESAWRNYLGLAAVVLVASLNRETAVFIPVAFAAANFAPPRAMPREMVSRRKALLLTLGYLALWGVVFLALRWLRGPAEPVETIDSVLGRNLRPTALRNLFVNLGLFLGPLWFLTILGFRKAPIFVRRVAWVIPFYVVAVALWGVWYEVRLLMPLYPILVAFVLSFLYVRGTESPGLARLDS